MGPESDRRGVERRRLRRSHPQRIRRHQRAPAAVRDDRSRQLRPSIRIGEPHGSPGGKDRGGDGRRLGDRPGHRRALCPRGGAARAGGPPQGAPRRGGGAHRRAAPRRLGGRGRRGAGAGPLRRTCRGSTSCCTCAGSAVFGAIDELPPERVVRCSSPGASSARSTPATTRSPRCPRAAVILLCSGIADRAHVPEYAGGAALCGAVNALGRAPGRRARRRGGSA